MEEKSKYWLIGYTKDFELLIVGIDTGPYSQVPDTGTGYGNKGKFLMINLTKGSGRYGRTFRAPIIDEMCRREPNSEQPFNSINDIYYYLRQKKLEEIISEAAKDNFFMTREIGNA